MSAAPVIIAAILLVTLLIIWWWGRRPASARAPTSPVAHAFGGVCAAVANLAQRGEDFLRRVGDNPAAPCAGYAASVRDIVAASASFVRFDRGLADPEAVYAGLASADELFWRVAKSYMEVSTEYDAELAAESAAERSALKSVALALISVNRSVAALGAALAVE